MAEHRRLRPQQSRFRIVTELERRYAGFDGLNLTQPTLAGTGQTQRPAARRLGRADRAIPGARRSRAVLSYDERQRLDLSLHASLEAQAAAIADDIAYDAHDIDDGLRAGFFSLG